MQRKLGGMEQGVALMSSTLGKVVVSKNSKSKKKKTFRNFIIFSFTPRVCDSSFLDLTSRKTNSERTKEGPKGFQWFPSRILPWTNEFRNHHPLKTNSAGWPAGGFSQRLATPIHTWEVSYNFFSLHELCPKFCCWLFFSTKIIAEKGIWEEFLHDVVRGLTYIGGAGRSTVRRFVSLEPVISTASKPVRNGPTSNVQAISAEWDKFHQQHVNWNRHQNSVHLTLFATQEKMISLFIIHFPNLGHFLEVPTISKALCTFQLHVENDDLPGFRFRRWALVELIKSRKTTFGMRFWRNVCGYDDYIPTMLCNVVLQIFGISFFEIPGNCCGALLHVFGILRQSPPPAFFCQILWSKLWC